MLGLFFDDWPRLASEVRTAIAHGDAVALGRLGHTVAGSAGNFSATAVVAAARKLESLGRSGELAGSDDLRAELERAVERFREAAGVDAPIVGPP